MTEVKVDDIIQIIPKSPKGTFDACLFIVDEVGDWGVRCYMINPGSGIIPYRAAKDEYIIVGRAMFLVEV